MQPHHVLQLVRGHPSLALALALHHLFHLLHLLRLQRCGRFLGVAGVRGWQGRRRKLGLGLGLLEQLRQHVGGLALLRKKARCRSSDVLGNCSRGVLATF